MKILYFDCPMGVSGDMFLGALIDLGVAPRMILRELKKLPLGGEKIDIKIAKEIRHSITGTSFRVALKESHHHRTFKDIKALIKNSRLSPSVKKLSTSIFTTIAQAEGRIHGISADKVHFHEVGAMDSIIDIVGAAVAVESLGIDRFHSAPVALGSGRVRTMHGTLPVPAPATLEILKGVPVRKSDIPFELTTPTGAAIVKTLTDEYGSAPDMVIENIGYGAGKKDFREAANLLRVIVGRREGAKEHRERLFMLETNIDDMSPQIAGYLMERLFDRGALDVFFTPVTMKKTRPGTLLTVLAEEGKKEDLMDAIFDESTSIGVRTYPVERRCLERRIMRMRTAWGPVGVKVSARSGVDVNVQPEYEDCRAIAQKKGVPLKKVMDAARSSAENSLGKRPKKQGIKKLKRG